MIKKNIRKLPLLMSLAVVISSLLFAGCNISNEKTDVIKAEFLKVGKADAIVIQLNEKTMVIDAGEKEDGEEVVEFLRNQGISKIDVMVITHYDKDHVGGADTVIEEMDVSEIIVPNYDGANTDYIDFVSAMQEKNIIPKKLDENLEFDFNGAVVLIEPPVSYEKPKENVEYDNNFSLIVTVKYKNNKMVFTGDIEKQRIRQWISLDSTSECDFIKMPHHGIYNKAVGEMLEKTKPKFAVICSSNKNPADNKTLQLLKQTGTEIYQTKDGNITMLCDGENIEIKQKLEN